MSEPDHLKEGLRKLRAANGERYDSAIIVWEEANAITHKFAMLQTDLDGVLTAVMGRTDNVHDLPHVLAEVLRERMEAQQRVAELEAALKPFAEYGERIEDESMPPPPMPMTHNFTRAARILKGVS